MSSVWSYDVLPRHDARKLALWIALSLALHVALLAWTPRPRVDNEKPEPPSMTVVLRTPPAPVAEPESAPAPTPPVRAQPTPQPRRDVRPRPTTPREPVIALAKPAPAPPMTPLSPAPAAPRSDPAEAPTPSTAPIAPQMTSPPPAETDLSAFIEARRRARGDAVETAAPEVERANRGALANPTLKPSAPLTFDTSRPTHSGGLFQIRRRGFDYAEFMFYGWNENFRSNGLQLIEVRKGEHSDIDIAVIRKIIEIIRNYERGDFKWHSKRTGKTLTLSARARDNAGLEEFMMQEFREELHRYR